MYSNIDTMHGIDTVHSWLLQHHHDDGFPDDLRPDNMINKLVDLLQLVMTLNIFSFSDTNWLQLRGTAMGTSIACVYATIYYSYHEE